MVDRRVQSIWGLRIAHSVIEVVWLHREQEKRRLRAPAQQGLRAPTAARGTVAASRFARERPGSRA